MMNNWKQMAKRKWGKQIEWIIGNGPFALLAWCRVLTITLWQTELEAQKEKEIIDKFGCGGFCNRNHQIIDLNSLLVDNKVKDEYEPDFPMSLVLQRTKESYRRGYKEGQEDLSITADFKIKEFGKTVEFYMARDKDGWGYWRDLAISFEKQLRFAEKDKSFWQSGRQASNFLLREAGKKIESLNKQVDKLKEREQLLKQVGEEDYKAKWLKAEADKIEILQSGGARR